MKMRALSPEELAASLEHARRYHAGEIEKPAYIDEWQAEIDKATMMVAQAQHAPDIEPTFNERLKDAVVKMMLKKDRLYDYWVEGRPYRTWHDIATTGKYTDDELYFQAVVETEDCLNGPGVQWFVLYLDLKHFPGVLNDFAHACLRDCDALLEEVIELTPADRYVLAYPQLAFGTENREVIETKVVRRFSAQLSKEMPAHVQRLLLANIMVALGNTCGACTQMEFARCEAAADNFPELMRSRSPEANVYLEQAQRWLITMLRSVWR